MKALKQIFYVFWKVFFLTYFVATMILLYPFFRLLLSREQWFKYCFSLMRFWAYLLLLGAGIVMKIERRATIPKGPFIICANHASYLDIIITYCIVPEYFVFMGKQELSKVPLFNIFFKKMNILVDRKSTVGSHKALIRAAEDLDQGHCVAIFPEGTISKTAPVLKPFKNGPFRLAIEKQVPILPITFLNNFDLLQDKAFLQGKSRPGVAKVVIHPIISTEGLDQSNIETLKSKTEAVIIEPLHKAHSQVFKVIT